MTRSSTPGRYHFAFSLVLLALVLWAGSAQAQSYTFEGLADTRGRFQDFGLPVINGNGDVAFAAQLRTGGAGIYKWSAATRTLVTVFEDHTNGFGDLPEGFRNPALTPGGVVIFQYGSRILAGHDIASLTAIVDSATTRVPLADFPGTYPCLQPVLRSRSTDASGRGVISCTVDDGPFVGGGGVYLAGAGTIERVCDEASFGLPNRFTRCFFHGPLDVSLGGVVAGVGFDVTRFDQFGIRQLLLRGTSNGLDVLLDPGLDTALAFPNTLSRLGINENGTVAYDALQEALNGSGYAIFTIDSPGQPTSITDPRNFVYRFAVSPSINAVGEVAFTDILRNGLFNGPDPAANKVMGISDTFPGYAIPGVITSVATVSFAHPGINTRGELTFVAHLGDGTLVIARAFPPNNHPPDVIFGDQTTPEGVPIAIHVTASDQDGDYPLEYRLSPNLLPPPGAVVPTMSPLPVAIDINSGEMTGAFGSGTAGQSYAFTVSVEDSRGRLTSVDFVWTVTEPLPPPRQNLRATANFAGQGIDLIWSNPSPDPVDRITVSYSTNGPAGPFFDFQELPAGTTSYPFVFPTGSGIGFCFTVNGLIVQATSNLVSPNSNVACASYPRFEIGLPQPPSSAIDNVFFRVAANMPARLTLDPASIASLPPGALWLVSPVPAGELRPTTFDVSIWNLPVSVTPTAYSVVVVGDSIPVGLDATHTVPFTTPAGTTPPIPGPGRAPGESAHRQGPLQVRLIGSPTLSDNRTTSVTLELTNHSQNDLRNLHAVAEETWIVSQCIQTIEACFSQEPTKVRPLLSVGPWPDRVLEPGASLQVTLRFQDAFARAGGFSLSPTLHLALGYEDAAESLVFTISVNPLPDLPSDLVITVPHVSSQSDSTVRMGLTIRNEGLASSGRITLEISVNVTRSAVETTPMPFTIQPVDWSKKEETGGETLEVEAGACQLLQGGMTCTLPYLDPDPPGERRSSITADFVIHAPDGGLVQVVARVRGRVAEANYANNTKLGIASLVRPQPILDVWPTISPTGATSRVWQIGVRNAGPAAATSVVLEIVLSPALRLSSSGGLCTGPRAWGAILTCRFPLIPAGSTVLDTVAIEKRPSVSTEDGLLQIVNHTGGVDINPDNNSVVVSFR